MHPLVSTSGESPNVLSLLDDRRRKKSAFRKAEMPGKSGAQRKSSSVKSPGSFLECDERRRRIAKLASREG